MAHRKKGKTWKKGKVTGELPGILNVRCCCTPTKILGTVAREFAKGFTLKYFGESNEIAIESHDKTLSFWEQQKGFVAV